MPHIGGIIRVLIDGAVLAQFIYLALPRPYQRKRPVNVGQPAHFTDAPLEPPAARSVPIKHPSFSGAGFSSLVNIAQAAYPYLQLNIPESTIGAQAAGD
jgi:hypothetical protein